MNKLPKTFKKRWVRALRSGRFIQSTGILADENGSCCLGVAGIICGIKHDVLATGGLYKDTVELQEMAAKHRIPKVLIEEGIRGELTEMNDNGTPFPEIADYIEENL